MASSQVEIALTSPFGCVQRKYNDHDRFRESASSHRVSSPPQGTFQNNCTSFAVVGDHYHHNVAAQGDVIKKNINNSNVGYTKEEKEYESLSSPNNNNNNNVNPRQSQILDRWAARKAKEMVSTIETEAELLENMGCNNSALSSSSSTTTTTTTSNNRGALSLVQIWEKRLNNLNQSLKCNTIATSRTSSLGSSDVGEIFTDESSTPSSYSDSVANDTSNEATTCSTPKVADIIKRLKENNNYGGQEQSNNPNNNSMMIMGSSCLSSSRSEQGQHNTSVVHSPRIRGRRALTDLLMQMERDRHGELNNLVQLAPVSNFSHRGRGRIQSLLRLRLLKRHHDQSTKDEVMNRPPRGSSITHLRERFNIEMKQGSTSTQPKTASPRNTHPDQPEKPLPPHNPRPEHGLNPILSGRVVDVRSSYQNASDDSLVASTAHKPESQTNEEEAHASSSETAVCLEEAQDIIEPQEVAETSSCNNMVDSDANHDETKDEADLAEVKQMDNSAETEIFNYVVDEATMNITEQEEEDDNQYASEGNDYDVNDEQNYDDDEEHYYDWISPIARPRSYWEDRRQAWYKEMLDSASSDNRGEIRQLLQRRTVSSFLSSDMRERMDKLMEYHIGTQTQFMSSVQEDDEDGVGTMGQLMSFLQQHVQRHGHNLEEVEPIKQEAQEEEEEEESLMNDDQSSSSSSTQILNSSSPNMSSWSYRDNEGSDDSDDRVDEPTATATTPTSSTQPSPRSQSFYQHSRQPSSSIINPDSMEMYLMYDMREKMEQMYREMAEIRKSLKSCIDMQMMLQKSMKREVSRALRERKKKKKSNGHQKGNCCICRDNKVDSLLYRCGHMCTCMKCANELQWNSGKCPICRAPIADVVRVYVDA